MIRVIYNDNEKRTYEFHNFADALVMALDHTNMDDGDTVRMIEFKAGFETEILSLNRISPIDVRMRWNPMHFDILADYFD